MAKRVERILILMITTTITTATTSATTTTWATTTTTSTTTSAIATTTTTRSFTPSRHLHIGPVPPTVALWFRITKNWDVFGHSLIRLFVRSLAPLIHLLVPHCSLRRRTHLRSFIHLLACSLISLPGLWECVWFYVSLSHCFEPQWVGLSIHWPVFFFFFD